MKKIKMLLLSIAAIGMMLMFSACADNNSGSGAQTTVPEITSQNETADNDDNGSDTENGDIEADGAGSSVSIVIPAGFVEYNNDALGFSVHHPGSWVTLDESFDISEAIELIDELGGEVDAMLDILNSVDVTSAAVIWYDFDNMVEDFAANTNIVVNSSGGATVEDLKSPSDQADLQDMFVEMYNQIFEGFELTQEISGRYLGNNYFVTFQFNAAPMDIEMSFYQAMTIANGQMFTFTHTTPGGRLNVSQNAFEQMMSTLVIH
ncbi:MAG: hypothetical protein FWE29_05330 [Defluviitaleaceae bacterium]|nr:hypothetical protein [Defluviitaleaceae bacterium]